MHSIKGLFDYLEKVFPLEYQEEYDNSGRQISFDDKPVEGILVAMDVSPVIIDEARENNCNCIITHHPIFFKPIKNISLTNSTGQMVIACIQHEISIYATHTNADAVCWDLLAKSLELNNIELLFPDKRFNTIGYGATGNFENDMTLSDVLKKISQCLQTNSIIYYGDSGKCIKKLACLQGAGSRKINAVIAHGSVDCIITGDVGYHDALLANNNGIAVIDIGHYVSEKPIIDFLYQTVYNYLTKKMNCNDIPLMISKKEHNPMKCGM
ncbi:MAG: Nif3-like dinuclear metal center hexameric protein [Spirochaetota bacterium]